MNAPPPHASSLTSGAIGLGPSSGSRGAGGSGHRVERGIRVGDDEHLQAAPSELTEVGDGDGNGVQRLLLRDRGG